MKRVADMEKFLVDLDAPMPNMPRERAPRQSSGTMENYNAWASAMGG